jgi:magnesium transporter
LIEDAKEVLLKLFDADAEYSADTLEGIYDELEEVRQARSWQVM